MSDEERKIIKVSIPLITEDDIKDIDNNFESIVKEFTKEIMSNKDLAITQYIIEKQQKEIEDLKVKNNMKIIGNIDTIKIEDLEDILEPYYIPKSVIREKIEEIDNMIKENGKGKLQKYTFIELIIIKVYLEQELLEEKD